MYQSMLLELALVPVAIAVGILLHELVHYVAVWPMAEHVRLVRPRPTKLAVEYDYFDEDWRHRWGDFAGIMPLLLGLTVMLVAFFTVGFPEFAPENTAVFVGWLVFTVGGPGDFARVFA